MWANELTGYDTLKKTRLVLCYTVMFFALQWFCNLDLTLPETCNPLSTSVFDPSLSQKCLLVNPVSTGVNLLHAAVGCAQRWLISSQSSDNSTVKTIIKSQSSHFQKYKYCGSYHSLNLFVCSRWGDYQICKFPTVYTRHKSKLTKRKTKCVFFSSAVSDI